MRLEDFAALEHVTARQWGPFSPFSDAQIETAQVEIMLSRQLLRQVSVMEHRIDHIVDFAQGMRHELNNRGVTNNDIRRLERWAELISARRITFARAAQAAHIAGLRPLHTPLSHELMRPTHDAPDTNWEAHHHRQYRFGRNSLTTPCTFSRPLLFLGEDYGDTDDVEDFASPSLQASEPYVADLPVESTPVVGSHSASFLRQEVHEFTSVTSESPARLALLLRELRNTSDHATRCACLDNIAALYGRPSTTHSQAAISLVAVCLDSPTAHALPLPQHAPSVPLHELRAWYARIAQCSDVSAALSLCALGIGRAYTSDSMGDGPGRYSAAFNALPSAASERLPVPTEAPKLSRLQEARAAQKSTSHATAAHPPGSMPVRVIGGQRFAVPISRERAVSKRKLAMLQHAHDRACALAAPTATAEQIASIHEAVLVTQELAEYGAATGTLDKDDHAWEYWDRFSRLYGWDPMITAEYARAHPGDVAQRLAIFQSWVYPQIRGLKQADAKPRTVFNNYVLAIVRVLGREHVPMPKAKSIERNMAGLMRAFKNVYGHEALMPGRKQPFTPAMWSRIEALEEGTPLRGRAPWSPATKLRDRNLLRLGRVLWRCGHRLGEIAFHKSGEINYLTRSCLSISKADGTKIAAPTAADWRALRPGDCVLLGPCVSKCDQFGEEHCPFPSILPFDGPHSSAAAAIRDIELEQPCSPNDRRSTPLFCDDQLRPFTYDMLHRDLRVLLTALYGDAFAAAFSWHSIRIGLACALEAAGCPDAHIQLICRWSSPDSLQVYRQMGIEKNVYWVSKAAHVTFDATRVNNLPALDRHDAMREQVGEFDSDVADTPAQAGPPSTPIRSRALQSAVRQARSFIIHGGTVLAYASDEVGLIGLVANIPRNFWSKADLAKADLAGLGGASFACPIVAECVREFCHPDGERTHTYLIEHRNQYFAIKRQALVHVCLTAAQRAQLSA